MRFAVLCPGSSVSLFGLVSRPDRVIGVNAGACAFPCDWWVFLGGYTWDYCYENGRQPQGSPVLVAPGGALNKLRKTGRIPKDSPGLDSERLHQDHPEWPTRDFNWKRWSWSVAVFFAAIQGATEIQTFGMDWSGIEDFDGRTNKHQQRRLLPHRKDGKTRWAGEAEQFSIDQVVLGARGVSLERVTKDSTCLLRT